MSCPATFSLVVRLRCRAVVRQEARLNKTMAYEPFAVHRTCKELGTFGVGVLVAVGRLSGVAGGRECQELHLSLVGDVFWWHLYVGE